MIKDLIVLSFKTKIRSAEYRRSLIVFGVLIIYFSVFLYGYVIKSFSILDSLLNTYHISFFALFLKIFPFLLLIDIIFKILFKNNSLYISSLFQVCPISKKCWNIYVTLCNVFNLWNFYFFILFLPYLIRFAAVDETLTVFVLLWVSSILNNGICFWLKNYGLQLPVKTLIICSFYFALLYCMYAFISNNQHVNFVIVGVAFIILLAIFAIGLYLYLFSQKKVYVVESLVKQSMKFNKQETTLSLLKMEFIYIFRSKRLLLILLLPTILLIALTLTEDKIYYISLLMVILLISPTMTFGQYLFAIEANFFNGIWTKPIILMQLLETKYVFYMILTGIYAAILFPFVLYYHLNISAFFSITFYITFIFNLLLFPIVLYSKRLDLSSSPFFNYQGATMIPVIYVGLLLGISFMFFKCMYSKISNEWIFFGVIVSICAVFFFFRKRFLSMISSLFIKRRHKIMHRYMSS